MPLKYNKISIVSPSGVIEPGWIDAAVNVLKSWGCEVNVGRYAKEQFGRFAGTDEQRMQDLQEALDDESLDAILCSRGGYGLIRIIDQLNFDKFRSFPKLVIGFSDITVLHLAIQKMGLPSVHSFMAKHFDPSECEKRSLAYLKDILEGGHPEYELPGDEMNRPGESSGMLVGGNLSVLQSMRGTLYEPNYTEKVLFIEDISEDAYHIDRMMQNLRIGGVLKKISGLMVGHFTDCKEDPQMMKTIREIILDSTACYEYPVCFGVPSGHEAINYPLIFGANVLLQAGKEKSKICFS